MANPVEQFVIERIGDKIEVFGYDISFTNSSLWMVISVVAVLTFLTMSMRKSALVPGRLQMCGEMMYEFVSNMVNENIGGKGRQYFPFVFTIFTFLLFGNIGGLFPYSFTFASHIVVTGVLALFVFVATIIFGIYNHGTKFFTLFMPSGVPLWLAPIIVPIELVSFFIRPVTHSVRLFANMMAGHLILKIILGFAVSAASLGGLWALAGIVPMLANTVMLMFELLVAAIQAYVFAILACVYLKDSVDLHH